MAWRVWIWLLSLALLWGGAFFFAKVALAQLGPLTVVFGRVALAALALNLVLAARGRLFKRGTPWRTYLCMGLLNNVVPFSLLNWAQLHIPSGLASILTATTPLFTLALAHVATDDEKINPARASALLCGLAGVGVLIGPAAGSGIDGTSWAEIACLAAAVSYAFAGIYGRRFRSMGIAPVEAAAGQVTASSMLILPIMLLVEPPWLLPAAPSPAVLMALARLALLTTALGYVLYFRILAAAGATNLLLVTFLMPPVAIVLGVAVLGERLGAAPFRGNGPERCRVGRDRRPARPLSAFREIAAGQHNCALGGSLLGCRRTRQNRPERVFQWPNRPPR
jgi:drug/metabolite transporter (DMT)-like permease